MDPEIIKNAGGLKNYYRLYDEVFEIEKVKRVGRFKLSNYVKIRDSKLINFSIIKVLIVVDPSKKFDHLAWWRKPESQRNE